MSELWRRIVALSDPQLTADFQYVFGVKPLNKCKQNGTLTSSDSDRISSFRKQSETEECQQSRDQNPSDVHDEVQNGDAVYQNGSAGSADDGLWKLHKPRNGISHRVVQNGTFIAAELQNGNACKCRHEDDLTPRSNGFIHDIPKADHVEDSASEKKSKQMKPYVIESSLIYYIFCFGASLGNETFYVLFFSFGLWTFDCCISRKISLIWCVIMYIGQASKDLICWPRPTSPPAIRLEGRYELEYGMPSTHAMVGVAIPFAMLYYTFGVYEYNLPLALVCAVIWCLVVSFSRLYLGMHSVLDIAVGIVGAIILLFFFIPIVDMLDCLLLAHPWSVPGLNLVGISLCLAYPRLKIWSTARGDTTQVMAVFTGIYQGLWYMTRVITPEMASASVASAPTGWAAVMAAVGRQVFGVIILVILLESLKKAVIYVSATLQGMDPKDPTCKQHLSVELPYKYIGYYFPSFCAAYFMPVFFEYIGCHRGNFLTEVLTHSHHFGL